MSVEERLTARITADVSEAVEGFRKVKREAADLQSSVKDVARGFAGVATAGYALYRSYDAIYRVQQKVDATQEEITRAYIYAASIAIPGVISGVDSAIRLHTALKAVLASATVTQWLYNKALAVTHALSGPAGWAILGVAAAVTAGAVAWASMTRQQQEYNRTLSETAREFRSLESELAATSPIERLQRQYEIVKEYYGYSVSVGNVNVSATSLGSPLDRDRTAEDIARKIGHRLALKVITR